VNHATQRRTESAVIVAGLVGGLALAGCSAAASGPDVSPAAASSATSARGPTSEPVAEGLDPYYSQTLDWTPCDGGRDCATLTVPLDYEEPGGRTIEIALLRVGAPDPGRRLGSLVVNPGGPGASGVEYAAAAEVVVSPEIREAYDVVGFDPRGVGRSAPVECVSDEQLDEALTDGDATPETAEDVAELLAGNREFREGCLRESSDLLPHVGTRDVARDLDVLRAALGEATLTYLGKSYGSAIGAEYARQFDDRVGRFVLDGGFPPGLTQRDVLLGQSAGFELALSRFVEACLAEGCRLGETEDDVLRTVDDILTATDTQPLPTSSDRPLTQSLAFYGVVGPLYWPPSQGYALLESALQDASRGDGTGLLQLADVYLQRSPDGTYAGNQWDVFTTVSCLDRPGDETPADVEAALPEFESASPRFGELLAWGLLTCTDWPVESDGLPSPAQAPDAPPVLVLGTTGDPATPYEWAVDLADQLVSGVLLTYDATPHTAYRKGSRCIDSAVDAYLIRGVVPAAGERCS
jgi:pimeloyl-ACP methyl ester carboxylesterase